jgi:uncharacterized protein DUF4193
MNMPETEDRIVDEDVVEDDEDLADAEASEASEEGETPAVPQREAAGAEVESIEELIVKKEAEEAGGDEDEEEATVAPTLTREERLEPLAEKVVPPQDTEFTCKKCYLVKHRSQLKDRKRMLCRDCA